MISSSDSSLSSFAGWPLGPVATQLLARPLRGLKTPFRLLYSFSAVELVRSTCRKSSLTQKGPYDPTTATSTKTSLKNRLHSFNFFAIIPSRPDTEKKGIYVRAEERGPPPSSDRDVRIYSVAVPFLK